MSPAHVPSAADIHTLVVRSSHCFVRAANAFLKLFDQAARLRIILQQPLRVAP